MILENAIDRHGYAVLLLQAYHTDELSFDDSACESFTRITPVWHEFAISELHANLINEPSMPYDNPQLLVPMFNQLFPNLRQRYYDGFEYADYNDWDPDEQTPDHVWIVQGSPADLRTMLLKITDELTEGHFSGDDTVYDYWPSAFGCAVAMANDLDTLTNTTIHMDRMREVWDRRATDYEAHNPNQGRDMMEEVTVRP